MPNKIKRIIPVTPDHSVILYEAQEPRDGAYILIKHNPKINDIPGEVFIDPEDVPALVQSLIIATKELTKSTTNMDGEVDSILNSTN